MTCCLLDVLPLLDVVAGGIPKFHADARMIADELAESPKHANLCFVDCRGSVSLRRVARATDMIVITDPPLDSVMYVTE